tara:strand:+ start:233 stop:511 length:279 start_codon:yes stop_codon:yes gene_type:complete
MLQLNEVLEFIKNSDQSQINNIRRQVEIRRSELNFSHKSSFSVGDVVGIDHKKVDPNKNFRIFKINSKNIKVSEEGNRLQEYTVSPSLLVRR